MIARLALITLAALGLAGCAPSGDGEDNGNGSPPLSYELAMAKQDAPSSAAPPTRMNVVELSPEEVHAKIETGNVRLIDVRTAEEVAEGAIPGAKHIPLDEFDPASLGTDDGREIVLYCRSGRRSAIAAERLAEHIGKPVQHLAGGILGWSEAGYAIAE